MRATIAIPPGLAYDCNEPFPIRPGDEADFLREIHAAVHGFALGTEELARRMRMPLDTLRQKANTNNPQHNFKPEELMRLVLCTSNAALVSKMASGSGCVIAQDLRGFDGDLMQAFVELQLNSAELMRQAADLHRDLESGKEFVSVHDENRVRYCVQEVMYSLMCLQKAVADRKRPAPKVEA